MLRISVVEGRSFNSPEGSYCVITYGPDAVATALLEGGDPMWNETFDIAVDPAVSKTVLVEVLRLSPTAAADGSDEELVGQLTIPIAGHMDGDTRNQWYRLESPPEIRGPSPGELRLMFQNIRVTPQVTMAREIRALEVRVIEARGLAPMDHNGLADPLVRVMRDGKVMANTAWREATLAPVWDETFLIPLGPGGEGVVEVEVYDKDMLQEEFMGRTVLNLPDFSDFVEHDVWYKLAPYEGQPPGAVTGEIRLGIRAMRAEDVARMELRKAEAAAREANVDVRAAISIHDGWSEAVGRDGGDAIRSIFPPRTSILDGRSVPDTAPSTRTYRGDGMWRETIAKAGVVGFPLTPSQKPKLRVRKTAPPPVPDSPLIRELFQDDQLSVPELTPSRGLSKHSRSTPLRDSISDAWLLTPSRSSVAHSSRRPLMESQPLATVGGSVKRAGGLIASASLNDAYRMFDDDDPHHIVVPLRSSVASLGASNRSRRLGV